MKEDTRRLCNVVGIHRQNAHIFYNQQTGTGGTHTLSRKKGEKGKRV